MHRRKDLTATENYALSLVKSLAFAEMFSVFEGAAAYERACEEALFFIIARSGITTKFWNKRAKPRLDRDNKKHHWIWNPAPIPGY